MSDYREHQPTEALKPVVECFWTRVGGPGLEARVLPDGAIDVIFDLAASSPSTSAFVVGTMTAPVVVKPLRTRDYVAIRFHPGGAQPLFGGSMRELTDRRVDLGSLWSHQVASEWTERLGDVESPSVRVQILERLLTRRIVEVPTPELRVREAIRHIKQSRGSLIVESLSSTLGLTRQHLTRLFELHVGIGVKFFSRVIRLRHVLSELERGALESCRVEWARLAVDAGYFDQAHFIRDFRALTGLTPERFEYRD